MNSEKMIVAPGCYDGISAKIVERIGFKAAYLTGFGAEASILGTPDIGLTSLTELVSHAKNIASAVNMPVICDGESGFGDAKNIWREVREFEKAGVAGIHIEDQILSKKCGSMGGRQVVSLEEAIGRIRAACDARTDPDFIIIARSDARYMGLDEVMRRLNAYHKAGADLVMVAEWYSEEELRTVVKGVQVPWTHLYILHDVSRKSSYEHFTIKDYEDLGTKLLILPTPQIMAATKAIRDLWTHLKEKEQITKEYAHEHLTTYKDFWDITGLPEWIEREEKYVPGARSSPKSGALK